MDQGTKEIWLLTGKTVIDTKDFAKEIFSFLPLKGEVCLFCNYFHGKYL